MNIDEITKLKSIINDFENSSIPLTKPKLIKNNKSNNPNVENNVSIDSNQPIQHIESNQPIIQSNEHIEQPIKEKKKRIKTPAQLEAFKKAQEARKINLENKKKTKEYESAVKLLQYYQNQPTKKSIEIIDEPPIGTVTKNKTTTKKPKQIKPPKTPEPESESDKTDSECESSSEEEQPPKPLTRQMKSMKNKKYNDKPQINKPRINYFVD